MYNNDYGIEPLGVSNSQMDMVHSLERKINELKIKHEKDKDELLLKIKGLENQYIQVLSLVQHTGRERMENNYQSNANLNNFSISSSHEYIGMPVNKKKSPGSTSSREYIGMPVRKSKRTTKKKTKRRGSRSIK